MLYIIPLINTYKFHFMSFYRSSNFYDSFYLKKIKSSLYTALHNISNHQLFLNNFII